MSSDRRAIAEGIAAIATTAAEMGQTEDDARRQVLQVMRSLVGGDDPALLLEAADAVTRQPQPPSHPVHQMEQREQIERMLGVTSPTDQLAASLRGREWLRNMAADLTAGA